MTNTILIVEETKLEKFTEICRRADIVLTPVNGGFKVWKHRKSEFDKNFIFSIKEMYLFL